MEKELEKERLKERGQIKFYTEDGELLGAFPLPELTDHSARMGIAESNGITEWSHYTVRDSGQGVKRDNAEQWYVIENGIIIKKI